MEKEKKKGGCLKKVLIVIAALIVLGIIGSALGDDEEPTVVDNNKSTEQGQSSTSESKENEPQKTEFSVGETVELNDVQVTLSNAVTSEGGEYTKPDDGNEFLILEFDIANNSDSDIGISSMMNFEAYCDDYSINQDLLGLQAPEAEGMNQLDGSVAAGKKMNGVIAYQVPKDYKKFEVSVTPDFWSSKDIKFVIKNK